MRITRPALTFAALAALCLSILTATYLGVTSSAANAQLRHGTTVPEAPRRDTPVVLDGTVFAHAQIGNRIFVGGDFQRVQRPNGTVITQPYIFAYDINTGEIDENFRPELNNSVQALEAAPNETGLYAAGRFVRWDDSFPTRIARLFPDGRLDTNFQGSANAIVRDIAVTSKAVYLAGDFTEVTGRPRIGFAAVRLGSGGSDTAFIADVQNTQAQDVGSQLGRAIVANADGSAVFGLHFGDQINGVTRQAVVKINTADTVATIANWSIPWDAQTRLDTCRRNLRDLAISPDGSFIVVAGQGRDVAPNCDSVLRYEANATGSQQFTWSARMYSSIFSLAVSDVAVYAGGHFCAAPRNGAAFGQSTHPYVFNPVNSGQANDCALNDPSNPVNPSVRFPNDAVFRSQLAALNPANGQALPWDPGSNATLGVMDLTLIDGGLLAGQDNNRFGDDILTGRSGFFAFDFVRNGGNGLNINDRVGPTVTHTSPLQRRTGERELFGRALDESGVRRVAVRVQDLQTGLYWNGSDWQSSLARVDAELDGEWWTVSGVDYENAGRYRVRHWAWDRSGNVSNSNDNPTVFVNVASGDEFGPTLTHTSPTERLTGNRNVFGQVTDPSGVDRVLVRIQDRTTGLYWNGTGWQSSLARVEATINGTRWTVTAVPLENAGRYKVRHWAFDNVGNVSDSNDNPTTIIEVESNDKVGPTLTHTSPTERLTGNRNVFGQVTDRSGVDRVLVRIQDRTTGLYWNGTGWQSSLARVEATINGTRWTVTAVPLENAGRYKVRHWAFDNVGNVSDSNDNPTVFIQAS